MKHQDVRRVEVCGKRSFESPKCLPDRKQDDRCVVIGDFRCILGNLCVESISPHKSVVVIVEECQDLD